ncbi:MBL fold metallo-hydrolase [Piscinibacter sp.]|uniref:MBL fold metallo-hydrolase n=1 Tax=Piscinibacter sp. TaxID=1903157 RepID=UPI0039E41F4E
MRFCSLGSGSAGNATVVEARDGARRHRVLIDCGFSLRELELRLARVGLQAADLHAIFITHEHGDHVGCAALLARRYRLPLWTSRGTWRAIGADAEGLDLRFARDGEAIAVGALQLLPFTVPHDAAEPLQLRCGDGAASLGVLTDVGSITTHLLERLRGCDALLLECNHDAELLARSRYPASLKARIGGSHGHLSNATAARILAECLHGGLRHVVAAHLSEQNNTPALARAALAAACGAAASDIVAADPAEGFDWLDLG